MTALDDLAALARLLYFETNRAIFTPARTRFTALLNDRFFLNIRCIVRAAPARPIYDRVTALATPLAAYGVIQPALCIVLCEQQ